MIKTLRATEETGRSMVEMLGVLAIVGVLSIGGIAGYSKAMAKYKINKTLDQVSMIITNIRTTFGNQSSYHGLTNTTAVSYELVGNDLSMGTTSTLKNAYNGDVTIEADDCDSTYCPSFTISYKNFDKQACAAVASSDWGGTASSGLISISVAGTEYEWSPAGENASNKLPISFATAMGKCTDTPANNEIIWKYN